MVPTNRPERFDVFKKEWKSLFKDNDVTLYPVWDTPEGWKDIPEWIPRQTDMIRSWGFLQAYTDGCKFIISLDDDVLPRGNVFESYRQGFDRLWPCSPYFSVGSFTDTRLEMRGFPYEGRDAECVVQYGGWIGVPDLDAATQIENPISDARFMYVAFPVPKGVPVTTCAMNFAFKAEYTPIMWQFPLQDGKFNRFGDIWSGLVQKRILDCLGKVMVVNGRAAVQHERASDPSVNLVKEGPGLPVNEGIWDAISRADGWNVSMLDKFVSVTDAVASFLGSRESSDYSRYFTLCRNEWVKQFE